VAVSTWTHIAAPIRYLLDLKHRGSLAVLLSAAAVLSALVGLAERGVWHVIGSSRLHSEWLLSRSGGVMVSCSGEREEGQLASCRCQAARAAHAATSVLFDTHQNRRDRIGQCATSTG